MIAAAELRVRRSRLPILLRRNLGLLHRVTEGLDDDAARTPLIPGGSHLAWLLAHLVASRDAMLRHLNVDGVWDAATAERYARGSDPAGAEYPPLAALLALLDEQQGRLSTALEAATLAEGSEDTSADPGAAEPDAADPDAAEPDAAEPGAANRGAGAAAESERLDRLEFLVWHETYHLGQGVLYRRAAGLASPVG